MAIPYIKHICGVYEIVHQESGKRYVGSSVKIAKRWKLHISQLSSNKHHCRKLQKEWSLYGRDAFLFNIIEECSPELLVSTEQKHMDSGYHYNTSPTAGSCLGTKHTKATKEHKSRIQKERFKKDPSYRDHLKEMGKMAKSEEWKEKASQRMLGVPKSKTQIVNMSKARSELNEDQLREIISLRRSGKTIKEIMKETERSFGQIQKICSGKSYIWAQSKLSKEEGAELRLTTAGERNRAFNPTIFEFTHPVHGTRVCTQYDLKKEFPELPAQGVSAVCTGSKRSYLGWRLLHPVKATEAR